MVQLEVNDDPTAPTRAASMWRGAEGRVLVLFSSTNSIDDNNKNTQAITKWQEDLLRNTVNSLKAMSFHVSSLYVTALHPYVNCVFF